MLKILIVEDDFIIRKGLCKNIPWEKHGYKVVASAEDGEQALEYIKREYIDIVITDIKMPFMDGIELAAVIYAEYPRMKVILLTGYEDFEYMRQAIQYKTIDYILKPVNYEKLLESMKKASEEIFDYQKIHMRMKESIPLLRLQFLNQLVTNKCKRDEIQSRIDFLDISLRDDHFIACVIKIDDFYNEELLTKIKEKELLKFAVLNISEEIFHQQGSGIIFDGGEDQIIMVVNFSDKKLHSIIVDLYQITEDIRLSIEKNLHSTVTIGLGGIHQSFENIYLSLHEAQNAIEFRHIYGKNRVLSIQETGLPSGDNQVDLQGKDSDLSKLVRLGLTDGALDTIHEVEALILKQSFVSIHYVRLIVMQIIFKIYAELEEFNNKKETVDKTEYLDICNNIAKLETIKDVFHSLRALVEQLTANISRQRKSQQGLLVEQASQIIKSNYMNENLSLQFVAKQLYISPIYLSTIFKKEASVNFIDYLLEIRMNHAMELIKNSNYKAYEVAEQVGFSNLQYFSTCFKKYTGMSPSAFKKQ